MNFDEMSIKDLNLTILGAESYLQGCNDTIQIIVDFLQSMQKSNEQMWKQKIENIKQKISEKENQQ